MAHEPTMNWLRSDAGLALVVDQRSYPVPHAIAAALLGPNGNALTGDPVGDLLTFEADLRATVADLVSTTDDIEERVRLARVALDTETAPHWAPGARRRRHSASTTLVDAIDEFATASNAFDRVGARLATLRSFVIQAGVPSGPLGEAARGWRRNPDRPSWVTVFDSEDDFLDADPRRTGGAPPVGAGPFGRGWRRDGDDDPYQPSNRCGCWTIGILDATAEIYAVRRSPHRPVQLWLLATTVPAEIGQGVLARLLARMPEPNSLILVADTVHLVGRSRVAAGLEPDDAGSYRASQSISDTTVTDRGEAPARSPTGGGRPAWTGRGSTCF